MEVGQGYESSEAVDDASSYCLVLNDPSLFLAPIDGLELPAHLGVVDGQPQTLLHVLQTVSKFGEALLQVCRVDLLSQRSSY